MKRLPAALMGLAKYHQFILYKIVLSPDPTQKAEKFPLDYRTGVKIDYTNPGYHADFDTVAKVLPAFPENYGIGFVLTDNDPFFLLDIDHCWEDDKDQWSQVSQELCEQFQGAAVEVSSSGKALHVIGTFSNISQHSCLDNLKLRIELFHTKRFIALTGTNAIGDVGFNCDSALENVIETYFKPKVNANIAISDWGSSANAEWSGPIDDKILIEKALGQRSLKSIFDNKATFKDLWENNVEILAQSYPPQKSGFYNASSVDMALAIHLAYWTGHNHERILQLMLQSSLGREKWNRPDYLKNTIKEACRRQTEFYKEKKQINAIKNIEGLRLVSSHDLENIFFGCVYVCDIHKILIPGGDLLSAEQFKVMYGGYTFALDSANQKFSPDAFKAFTQSQTKLFPKVITSCFEPQKPPGIIFEKQGRTMVNTWWPIQTLRIEGDPAPFLEHLEKMLPIERDRKILLSFLAANVQRPGKKIDWCPVIQGVEGNGKTLLALCLEYCMGERYCHAIKSDELTEPKHNNWVSKKLFAWFDDANKKELNTKVLENFKTLITAPRYSIQPKYVDSHMQSVHCNFIINSNFKDVIPKAANDRRFSIFYTAQQTKQDLITCGMNAAYFTQYRKWLDYNGYAIINNFLFNYTIEPDFDPHYLMRHAPETSSITEVSEISVPFLEVELIEAIAQGLAGFCGGWISSVMFDKWLDSHRYKIHRRERDALLLKLGYIPHPALQNGRTHNKVFPDGAKTRLFVLEHSENSFLIGDVGRAYAEAQMP